MNPCERQWGGKTPFQQKEFSITTKPIKEHREKKIEWIGRWDKTHTMKTRGKILMICSSCI